MINFLLSLIPNIITFLAIGVEFIAKVIMGVSIVLLTISTTLHKLLKTKVGLSLLEIEKSTNNIITMYTNIAKQVAESKAAQAAKQNEEDNKLAQAAKAATNIVQLGKKKDDST